MEFCFKNGTQNKPLFPWSAAAEQDLVIDNLVVEILCTSISSTFLLDFSEFLRGTFLVPLNFSLYNIKEDDQFLNGTTSQPNVEH